MRVKIENVSAAFTPALLTGNSTQAAFVAFQAIAAANPFDQSLETILLNDQGVPDGTYKAGWRGDLAQNRVQMCPFADSPGATFSMRLWMWREATQPGQSGYVMPVWVPVFIAEFSCTSGTIGGVATKGPPGPSPFVLPDNAYLCDTITLVQGALGLTGLVNSTGPGTNLPAYALAEILGARFVTYDFQQNDNVGMNSLWCFC